ncbi:hypothetical protein [Frondihabitans sp. Leaf304]|uniref:hypothetical protein n=1 Tax=Frondihabitans sp. Leaf304 TaxID=1736329 RepID=UPI0012FCD2B2|nr:hypothetical protein [Frondihabitans sp. Leaf304]
MGKKRGALVVGVIAAGVLMLGGCSATGGQGSSAPSSSPTVSAEPPSPTPTPTPTPSATPTTPAVTQPVAKTVKAGVVASGVTATASGTGPMNVSYERKGEFAVVVALNCSACRGVATVTAAGRMSPFGRAAAPLRGSFLMDVFKNDPVKQTFIVDAQGSWTVTLQSWNDLPTVSGAQSGTGPAVLFFSDDVSRLKVDFRPAKAGESFSGRAFTTSDKPLLFGESGAFSKTFEVDLPGVLAIQTNGTWTVTPVS